MGGIVVVSARPDVLALAAALGVIVAMSGRRWAYALPLGATALLDGEALPWAIAATAVDWRAATVASTPRLDGAAQVQLMRSRRRDEPASVLVMRAACPLWRAEAALWSSLRATDGFELVAEDGGVELTAVLDSTAVDRPAFEERVRTALGTREAAFGWAAFPADGFTLDVLVGAARQDLRTGRFTRPGQAHDAAPAVPAAAFAEGR